MKAIPQARSREFGTMYDAVRHWADATPHQPVMRVRSSNRRRAGRLARRCVALDEALAPGQADGDAEEGPGDPIERERA